MSADTNRTSRQKTQYAKRARRDEPFAWLQHIATGYSLFGENIMAKMPRYGKREDEAANRRGDALLQLPFALVAATLDEAERVVRLRFRNRTELSIPISEISEIADAPLANLRTVFASPLGDGLIFDDADAAIYVPGLLRDLFGVAFATALGKRGGRARTPAKVAASRKNGQKGGRPRKQPALA
jgi:hypothetical protein